MPTDFSVRDLATLQTRVDTRKWFPPLRPSYGRQCRTQLSLGYISIHHRLIHRVRYHPPPSEKMRMLSETDSSSLTSIGSTGAVYHIVVAVALLHSLFSAAAVVSLAQLPVVAVAVAVEASAHSPVPPLEPAVTASLLHSPPVFSTMGSGQRFSP